MSEGLLVLHVLQAVLADPQLGLLAVVLRKRREVPGVDLKVSYLDLIHIFHFGDLRGGRARRRKEGKDLQRVQKHLGSYTNNTKDSLTK